MSEIAQRYVVGATPVRQWHSAKTTGDKLDLVFRNAADNDGEIEQVIHIGGRDFVVLYSVLVAR